MQTYIRVHIYVFTYICTYSFVFVCVSIHRDSKLCSIRSTLGALVCLGMDNGWVKLFSVEEGTLITSFVADPDNSPVTVLRILNARTLLTATMGKRMCLWDLADDCREIRQLTGHKGSIKVGCVSPRAPTESHKPLVNLHVTPSPTILPVNRWCVPCQGRIICCAQGVMMSKSSSGTTGPAKLSTGSRDTGMIGKKVCFLLDLVARAHCESHMHESI